MTDNDQAQSLENERFSEYCKRLGVNPMEKAEPVPFDVAQQILTEADQRIAELEAEKLDADAQHKMVMDEKCPDDKVHCTCVPFLRKGIAELQAELERRIESYDEEADKLLGQFMLTTRIDQDVRLLADALRAAHETGRHEVQPWQPASEPPDSDRLILVHIRFTNLNGGETSSQETARYYRIANGPAKYSFPDVVRWKELDQRL